MLNRLNPRWRLIAVLVLYVYLTFVVIGGPFMSVVGPRLRVVHHVFLTLLMAGWLIGLLVEKRSIPATPLDWPLLAYFLVNLAAAIFAPDPRVSLEVLWELGFHILLLYILVDLMRRYGADMPLRAAFVVSAVVLLICALEGLSWYFGLKFFPVTSQGWFEIGGLRDPIPPEFYRLALALRGSTSLSGYLALLWPVGLAWALTTRSKETRVILIVWLVGMLVANGLTFSRGGIVSLVASIVMLFFLGVLFRPNWKSQLHKLLRDWRVYVVVAGGLAFAAFFLFGWLRHNIAGHQSGDVVRWDLWRSALKIGASRPLLGVGPGGFGRALRWARTPELARDFHTTPHNIPLLIWSESGGLGLLTFGWVVVNVIRFAFRRWDEAESRAERLRIAGVIAALVGFSAQNMFDCLILSHNMLPVLVLTAFLIYPYDHSRDRSRSRSRKKLPLARLAPVFALVLVILAEVGWGVTDLAFAHFSRAVDLLAGDDLDDALTQIQRARRLDPLQGYYAAQEAQILGRLTEEDPAYLPDALAAYEEALRFDDTYDVLQADYALLLGQFGELDAAIRHMEEAARILPVEPRYPFWLGVLFEQSGDQQAARAAYLDALDREPTWALSALWEVSTLRADVRTAYLASLGLAGIDLDDLAQVSSGCWPLLAGDDAARLDPLCVGEITLVLDDDPDGALPLLDQAIAVDRSRAAAYYLRARADFALGDLESAEQDARTALFLDNRLAYRVLGDIAQAGGDDDLAVQYYRSGGPSIIISRGWDVAVYRRFGQVRLLPQFDAPGPSRYDFASWLALVDLYERQGQPDQAAEMVEAIQRLNPYFQFEP